MKIQRSPSKRNRTLITITRSLARQLRAVFRHALGTSPRGTAPAVSVCADETGTCIRAKAFDAAVEYHSPGNHPSEEMLLPGEFLADCEGCKEEPVTLEKQSDGQVAVNWRDASVPMLTQYAAPEAQRGGQFPASPAKLTENPPCLLSALAQAMETTDPDCSRFATDHIELRGKAGSTAATNGRQLLRQSGFKFPWQDAVLIPRTGAFGCRELPQDLPVAIGKKDEWVTIRVGPWTVHLRVGKDRRFPNIDNHVPQAAGAVARLHLAPADAELLTKALPRLPCDDDLNWPVTIDLNGQVAIRARAENQPHLTELVLSRSTVSGDPVRFATNRRLLARALKLGFREILMYGPAAPAMCQDEGRQYVWALLDPHSALKPSDKAVRISSIDGPPETPATPSPPTKRRTKPVSETTSSKNGSPSAEDHGRGKAEAKNSASESVDLIEQAEAVKAALRDAHTKVSELIVALKRHQKQFKIVHSTLSSLRQLKAIGA